MAQLAVAGGSAALGAWAGSYAGMAGVGMSLGWMVGAYFGRRWFGPDEESEEPDSNPDISSLKVQSSTYGRAIPIIYGSMRTAGNVIWSSGIKAETNVYTRPGKGEFLGRIVLTFMIASMRAPQLEASEQIIPIYTCSFAVGICEGPIAGINRIWADGKLIQDNTDYTFVEYHKSAGIADSITVYTGTEDQEPDSVIESYENNSVPAYRGLAYIVFENLELKDYGNRIPNIEVEIAPGLESKDHFEFPHSVDFIDFWYDGSFVVGNYNGNWVESYAYGGECYAQYFYDYRVYNSKGELILKNENGGYATSYMIASYEDIWGMIEDNKYLYLSHFHGDPPPDEAYYTVKIPLEEAVEYQSDFWTDTLGKNTGWIQAGGVGLKCKSLTHPEGPVDLGFLENQAMSRAMESTPGFFWILWDDVENELVLVSVIHFGSDLSPNIKNQVRIPHMPWPTMIKIWNGLIYLGFENNIYEYLNFWDIADGLIYSEDDPYHWHDPVDFDIEKSNYNRKAEGAPGYYKTAMPNGDWVVVEGCGDSYNRYQMPRARCSNILYVLDGIGPNPKSIWKSKIGTEQKVSLAYILSDIFERNGLLLDEYDVSEMSNEMVGFSVPKSMSGKDAIEPLQKAFQFDVIEYNGVLHCQYRNKYLEKSFDQNQLSASESHSNDISVKATKLKKEDLPTKVIIQYHDVNIDYQVASQYMEFVTTTHRNVKNVDLPIVMNADQALQIAEVMLSTAWSQKFTFSASYLLDYIDILPGTVVDLVGYRALITDISLKLPGYIDINAISDELDSYKSSNAQAINPTITEQELVHVADTQSIFLNLPGLTNVCDNPGFFVVTYVIGNSSDKWNGAIVYKLESDEFHAVDIVLEQALVAQVTSQPNEGVKDRWDNKNEITISPINNSKSFVLTSKSEEEVLAGANTVVVGETGKDNWEIISFCNVTDNEDGTYTLSKLIRGRRGTERNINANKFTLVFLEKQALVFVPLFDLDDLGVSKKYKVTSLHQTFYSSYGSKSWVSEGDTIKPWGPVHIEGHRNSNNDLIITWLRRSRTEEGWWNSGDIALLENQEKYEIDVLDSGDNVVRTISTSGENSDQIGVTYTAQQQSDDLGSVLNSVNLKIVVYQINDAVGRGFPAEVVVYCEVYKRSKEIRLDSPANNVMPTSFVFNSINSIISGGTANKLTKEIGLDSPALSFSFHFIHNVT